MCPQASAGAPTPQVKYMWKDHDTALIDQLVTQNAWVLCFNADDVRLIWCEFRQTNDEAAAKDIEVRWTIDGNVYFRALSIPSSTWYTVYREPQQSNAGASGLLFVAQSTINAGYAVDKRGQSFKVEMRQTSALGTTQRYVMRCVYETLEAI